MRGDTARVLAEIAEERRRQDAKWGPQDHPDGTGPDELWLGGLGVAHDLAAQELATLLRRRCQRRAEEGTVSWADIALEEFAEALAEDDPVKLRAELIQKAAVAVAWVEAIDRRQQAKPAVDLETIDHQVRQLQQVVMAEPEPGMLVSDHFRKVLEAVQAAFQLQVQLIEAFAWAAGQSPVNVRVVSEHERAADARAEHWRRLVADLTRCEHGRIQEDSCFDCPGGVSPSQAGRVVGYGLSGVERVVVPPRELMGDPLAWRQPA